MGAALSPPCAPTVRPPALRLMPIHHSSLPHNRAGAPRPLALLPASISVYYLPTIWIPLSLSLLASNALLCSGIAYFPPTPLSALFASKAGPLLTRLIYSVPVCFLRVQMAPSSSYLFLAPASVPAAPRFQRRLALVLNSSSNTPPRLATARRLRCLYSAPPFPPPSAAGPTPPRFQRHPAFLLIPSRIPPRACRPLDAPVASVQRLRYPRRFCLVPTLVPVPPRFQHRPTLLVICSRHSGPLFAAAWRTALLPIDAAELSPVPTGRSAPVITTHRCCPPSPLFWLPLLFPCSHSVGRCRGLSQFLTAPSLALDPLDPARGLRTRPACCQHAPFPPRPLSTCSPLLHAFTTLPAPTTRDVFSFFIALRRLDQIPSPPLSATHALAPPPIQALSAPA
ncbi:hypothetical protein B0H14DRAFT_3883073 [Mycena olivaceomarginata]|nr:hypothetical protein B0H14DRAFT_3883073 [Mycena olivaceomarginata]